MAAHSLSPAHGVAPRTLDGRHPRASIPFLLLATAIIGAGILLYTEFMWTFDLIYLSSVLFFLVGGLMLFSRYSGPDSSS